MAYRFMRTVIVWERIVLSFTASEGGCSVHGLVLQISISAFRVQDA